MDSLDLLAREDEFKRLNKQLEKKSESLLKEIEHAMQKQDIFSEFSHSLTLTPTHTKKKVISPQNGSPNNTTVKPKPNKPSGKSSNSIKSNITENSSKISNENSRKSINTENFDSEEVTQNETLKSCLNRRYICDCCTINKTERISDDLNFLYAFVSVNVQEKVLPETFAKNRVTVESVCKYLSSKVKLMEEQIQKLQKTIEKKASQCDVHMTNQAQLESERLSLMNKMNNCNATAVEAKAKCAALQKRLDEKERLYKEQRSECDKLNSEVKRVRSKNASVEAKCASQEELIDNLRHQIDLAKRNEKDFRDSTRSLSASHENAISRLEARTKELTSRAQKQTLLIENLKKQVALLTADGAVCALENQFSGLLMSA